MRREYDFWVYILSSRSRSLYIGITNNLRRRVRKHREAHPGSHTARYNIHRLVYYEHFKYVINAITRETELKHWTRAQKIALIESINPTWEDMAATLWPDMPAYPPVEEKRIPFGNDEQEARGGTEERVPFDTDAQRVRKRKHIRVSSENNNENG
jgi:putative endonuclease